MMNANQLAIVLQLMSVMMMQLQFRFLQRQDEAMMVRQRRLRRIRGMRNQRRSLLLRQQYVLLALLAAVGINEDGQRVQRQLWIRPRSAAVWEEMLRELSDGEWREHFRMRKDTFFWLCDRLRPHIERENTYMRNAIAVEKRVAITLWRLATNVEFRTLSTVFGVARSTACVIVHDTVRMIVINLQHELLQFPRGNDLKDVIAGFESRWGFPQTAGAIDGTHIPIIAPKDDAVDYFNRKGHHSIQLQAVADYRYRFTDVYVGWAGSVHDARIFSNSAIFEKGQAGTLFPADTRTISGVEMPIVLLGDPAYPLLPWLMKGFSHQGALSREQRLFNYRQSRARMVIECAFGRLKGRWRCLMKRNDSQLRNLPRMVIACCILHNLCENSNEEYNPEWDGRHDDVVRTIPGGNGGNAHAEEIRSALVQYFAEGH